MKYNVSLNDLIKHVYKVYKEPSIRWSKAHFEKRCIQLCVAEQVLTRCTDAPFEDPRDIIENYMLEICIMQRENDNEQAAKMLHISEDVLDSLLRYLN